MSDRLNEALRVWGRLHRSDHNLNEIKAAARAYADLVNGERVEWCETHRQECSPTRLNRTGRASNDCRIVSRLLIDPPKEEE